MRKRVVGGGGGIDSDGVIRKDGRNYYWSVRPLHADAGVCSE